MMKKSIYKVLQRCKPQTPKADERTYREEPIPGTLNFRCNICGCLNSSIVTVLQRETPSCGKCHSTVRMRGIVHSLSMALFDKSISIPEFPERQDIVGYGMSDWDGYAIPLSKKLSYTNTFYHKEPRLDITRITSKDANSLDFLVSSDVFEHVSPPVSVAFENARKMLRGNGVFVFSVPYKLDGNTIEHFPNLYEYDIEMNNGCRVLVNRTRAGEIEKFENLIFHGGEGETLEVRVFSEADVLKALREAGFQDVSIIREPCFEHGVYWSRPWSLPIIARCFKPAIKVLDWGPRTRKVCDAANIQDNGCSGMWLKVDSEFNSSKLALTIGELPTADLVTNGQVITALIPKIVFESPGKHAVVLTIDNTTDVYVGEFLSYA